MSNTLNKSETMKLYFRCMDTADFDTAASLFADDAVYLRPPFTPGQVGFAGGGTQRIEGLPAITEFWSIRGNRNTHHVIEIESISANYSAAAQTINGNSVQQVSSFTYVDGVSYGTGDVYFHTDPTNSRYVGPINFSFEALLLPTARGYGNVKDLHLAVSEDAELYSLVENLAKLRLAETSQDFAGLAEAIAYRWAGVDGVDPDSRGGLVDARKIEALEAFLGLPYEGSSGPNPTGGDQVPYLNQAWDKLAERATRCAMSDLALLENRDPRVLCGQMIRGPEPGYSAPDDRDVDAVVPARGTGHRRLEAGCPIEVGRGAGIVADAFENDAHGALLRDSADMVAR